MQTRVLGKDLEVSAVGLGCMGFTYAYGTAMDEKEAAKAIAEAVKMGYTFFDTCETLDYLQKALDIGFTGVMYDGSTLPYAENLANTKKAVEMAKAYPCGVEAELGALASREGGAAAAGGPVYTDPNEAVEFYRETGIDAFAPSFGTAHGIYKA